MEEKQFEMKQVNGKKSIVVNETILCCPTCKRLYITQAMSRELVAKHPGYYVDASIYDLKSSKKAKQAKKTDASVPQPSAKQNLSSSTRPTTEKPTSPTISSTPRNNDTVGVNAPVYLTNTSSSAHNICPLCSSVLGSETVNIPVIETNGDFYRYYSENVRFCYKCRKAYLTKEIVASVLRKINESANTTRTIKLENATVSRSDSNRDYLFNPTMDNSYAVYFPGADYQKASPYQSDPMELNAQSFLGEMGYSVNRPTNVRHHILVQAIKKYGKRKVTDHIAFLIATRRGQTNGAVKYAYAIRIWQEDINFISNV